MNRYISINELFIFKNDIAMCNTVGNNQYFRGL